MIQHPACTHKHDLLNLAEKSHFDCAVHGIPNSFLKDRNNPSKRSSINVRINLNDVNDLAPQFEQDTYELELREDLYDVENGTQVRHERALEMRLAGPQSQASSICSKESGFYIKVINNSKILMDGMPHF